MLMKYTAVTERKCLNLVEYMPFLHRETDTFLMVESKNDLTISTTSP